MGKKVYANGMEIAHKSGDAKVIAAFPDVCLSPPPPPAGPVPVPYPNTSFARDLKQGSSTVMVGGKPLALKGKSYYKTSPLGDEAATRNFGGAVLTHTITGKTYFQAHSMDVVVEGKNVCRHLDITTSNHASYPGSTFPMANVESIKLALERIKLGKCPCCGKGAHMLVDASGALIADPVDVSAKPQSLSEWYGKRLTQKFPAAQRAAAAVELRQLLQDARARPSPCPTCKSKTTRVLPEPPCDVFFPYSPARSDHVKKAWNTYRRSSTYQARNGIKPPAAAQAMITARLTRARAAAGLPPPTPGEIKTAFEKDRQVNHLTPKAAGGCPTGGKNLQPHRQLCDSCKSIDDRFNDFQ